MGDRLGSKTELDLSEEQIGDESSHDQGSTPLIRWVSPMRITSRREPIVQKRVRWARAPINRPTASEISRGACMAPGPVSLEKMGPPSLN